MSKKSMKCLNTAKERLRQLRDLICQHDHYYYHLDNPEISDYEYDALFDELLRLEKQYPKLVDPNSPSQRVPGKALSYFEKANHKKNMLSLQNTYDTS